MRGSVYDVVALPIIIFAVIISVSVGLLLLGEIMSKGQGYFTDEGIEALSKTKQAVGVFADSVVFVVFALMAASVILAYYTPANPMFFPLSTIIGGIGVMISWMMSNVLTAFAEALPQAGTIGALSFLIANLPIISVVMWFLIAIVSYGGLKKAREGAL